MSLTGSNHIILASPFWAKVPLGFRNLSGTPENANPAFGRMAFSSRCPHEELNPNLSLRTGLLYPLSYEGIMLLL